MKTGIVRFNVKERYRKHTGVERDFDTAALEAVVNSPEVQERVKMRDMLGFLGHGTRTRYGMIPPEMGLEGRNQIVLEPAFVTTYLKADRDGWIEHEAEILPTTPGEAVKKYVAGNVGGFSSAIQAPNGVATDFYGLDYVAQPNYASNRPFEIALDSANPAQFLDEATNDMLREYVAAMKYQRTLLDSTQREYGALMDSIAALEARNAQLESVVNASIGGKNQYRGAQSADGALAAWMAFDSTHATKRQPIETKESKAAADARRTALRWLKQKMGVSI